MERRKEDLLLPALRQGLRGSGASRTTARHYPLPAPGLQRGLQQLAGCLERRQRPTAASTSARAVGLPHHQHHHRALLPARPSTATWPSTTGKLHGATQRRPTAASTSVRAAAEKQRSQLPARTLLLHALQRRHALASPCGVSWSVQGAPALDLQDARTVRFEFTRGSPCVTCSEIKVG